MEFIREDCIYARQSVDRKDSISIESQIDFCKYELKGGSCRVFKDKGYSGKNTDRPEFQKLLGEIRKGKVRRVIVYKLDRISRSILDFANMMELFQEYDVEFVSSTEKFDTSTPMGRAMLNICIVFAQLERETIQKRVTDAYYSRCLKGFHMSGQAPYGYQLEPTVVEGIRTKKMVADPVAADHVRLMFEMYAEPETSFGDITRYFEEQGIKIYEKSMVRSFLSQLLRNPVYAQADLELYEFFKSQGAAIVNDASDFAGTNGCYLYQGRDVKEDKDRCLKDQIIDREMDEVRSEMEVTTGLIQKLIDENATRKMDQNDYRKRYDGYVSRYAALESRMDSLEKERKEREFKYDIFSGFLFELGEIHELPLTFDDRLFYQLVDFATVYSDGRVVFTFRNGTEITTEM